MAGTESVADPFTISVGSDEESPARARSVLRLMLGERGWERGRVEEVCLAVTELVANAVIHGGGLTSLVALWDDDQLRVEVGDANVAMPVRRDAPPDRPGGRGLLLVEALASGWGATRVGEGLERKRVWALFTPAGP